MSDQLTPDLQARLDAWLANRAPTEIPASFADRIASIPRSAAPARRPRLTLVSGRRSTMSLLAAALLATSLAIVGGGLFVAVSQPALPEVGRLLYELDGDIYLANEDGADPIKVATDAGLPEGPAWAPDGRHFLSYHGWGTADIRDTEGRVVASFANLGNFNGYPVWSPDSTRLQAWTDGFRQISTYGLDGALQAELPLPEGYTRVHEDIGVWAPDGRSVWVRIAQRGGDAEVWELPIDGSAARALPDSPGRAHGAWEPSFTRDGTRMAFSDQVLHVANADGTDPRPAVRADQDSDGGRGGFPVWSPSGDRLAYLVWADDDGTWVDLKVVDIATGTARILVPGWRYVGPRFSWSPDGDKILFSREDDRGTGLWSIDTDGGDATLLVDGATEGEWQPGPWTPAPTPTP